jgi:hypothetical protein
MHSIHIAKWALVLVVIVLGLSLRLLFVWTPRSKRGSIIGVVLSVVLGLLAVLIGSGYIKL